MIKYSFLRQYLGYNIIFKLIDDFILCYQFKVSNLFIKHYNYIFEKLFITCITEYPFPVPKFIAIAPFSSEFCSLCNALT